MAISARTRKALWGRAASRCAICRRDLVLSSAGQRGASVVGEECHIVPVSLSGPRSVGNPGTDEYANLILLCGVHHKQVDDLPQEYPAERLQTIKAGHEGWVRSVLGAPESPEMRVLRPGTGGSKCVMVTSGAQLFDIIDRADAWDFGSEDLTEEPLVERVAEFLQDLQDMTDFSGEVGVGERIRTHHRWTTLLADLSQSGLVVYGAREQCHLEHAGVREPWIVALVRVLGIERVRHTLSTPGAISHASRAAPSS